MCSSKDSGTPYGIAMLGVSFDACVAICRRRSISRTSSRYCSTRSRSLLPTLMLEASEALGDRIQDAALLLAPRAALLGRAAVAEQSLEDDLRIHLHRQRPHRRLPRDRVRVDAAIAFAARARVRAGIFDRELQRRQQRLLTDLLRDDLIDRRAGFDVGAGRLLRLRRAEVCGGHEVIGARHARRILRRLRPEAAREHHVLAERLERLPDERILEAARAALRNPVAGRRTMRHENARESRRYERLRSRDRGQRRQSSTRAAATLRLHPLRARTFCAAMSCS